MQKKQNNAIEYTLHLLATGSPILFVCLLFSIFFTSQLLKTNFGNFFFSAHSLSTLCEQFIFFIFENWMQFLVESMRLIYIFYHHIVRLTWVDQWTDFHPIHRVPLILGVSLEVWSKSLFISSLLLSLAIQTVWICFRC